MADQYFHLTIGPVQAFVAQARRTRDFWAGSFILSYLSSIAMLAVRQQQGQIEFPVPDENFLWWLEHGDQQNHSKPLPKQGSVPNRFKAMEVKVSEGFEPQAVVDAVNTAWQAIAEQVWNQDLANIASFDSEQRKIWDRQTQDFWEISWCLTDDPLASNLLDRRKNWRSHVVADEPGVKCSLMEGYQELSGATRAGEEQRRFWQQLRTQNTHLARDIREDEYLCAIAFVKRRFAHHFANLTFDLPAIGQSPAKKVYGWPLPASVPSIAYMAATPWLAASIYASANNPEALEAISDLEAALKALDAPWEGQVSPYVQAACEAVSYNGRRWRQVDGQYLFSPALDQAIKSARSDPSLTDEYALLKQVNQKLNQVRKQTALSEPSPFYAILLMDGDSLGVQMSHTAKQKGISAGLNCFTAGVPKIVERYSGFLVYAGGDDVLAILPQPFAMDCAVAIRHHYDRCFQAINEMQAKKEQITTSISAAINFAHYKTPLTHVLQDAHQLLDDIAKEQTGRNSLAVRVHKPGGLNAQWSTPWDFVGKMQTVSKQVADHLQGDLSRSFFFKLEELIESLGLTHAGHGFTKETIYSLVRAAWSFTGKKLTDLPKGMEIDLLEACRVVQRRLINGQEQLDEKMQFAPGALKLIHFLATENQHFLRIASTTQEIQNG